uniref:Putative nucleotidyltransferase, ribonuclease H n=1 Tax=Tanacetum cinerariifolium TaxID=118510 RepID=A0A6L2MUG1_TANCI|nr:putative nucleotidyltransferase, ribonuclease H [Tanacetum cinerariifolium]
MRDREAAVKLLKQSLQKAQNRMKQQADKHRTDKEFEAGSWVYLKLQPYMQNTLRVHKHSKLTPKYFGPFLVVERVGKVAYRLDLPDETQIHPVFHVSLLKLAGGPPDKVIPISTNARFFCHQRGKLKGDMYKKSELSTGFQSFCSFFMCVFMCAGAEKDIKEQLRELRCNAKKGPLVAFSHELLELISQVLES